MMMRSMSTATTAADHSRVARVAECIVALVFLMSMPMRPAWAQGAAPAPRGEMQLFLLVGQSNMAGRGTVEATDTMPVSRVWMFTAVQQWAPATDPMHFDKPKVVGVGPGRAFGNAVAAARPRAEVGLIPAAVGGSSIRSWQPGAVDSATGTHPYDDAIARARAAAASGRLTGILWLQGESDGNVRNADDYAGRMRDVIANMRRDLGAPDVPFLIGQMGRFAERPWSEYRERVDSAHRAVVATTSRAVFVETGGLKHRGDTVHYDAASAREIGRRYAKSFLLLRPAPAR